MKQLVLLLLWLPLLVSAQIEDDFSDGDFTQNPQWLGTVDKFQINSNLHLQLNDNEAGKAYLSTANSMFSNCEWRFWVKQSFSPSSNNNSRVYLISNTQDLTASLQGYFLQLGESGSSDAIELFRQDGNQVVSVCRGTEGLISSSFSIGFKVTRDNSGKWEIFIDKDESGIYIPEASGIDNTWQSTGWFGFWAKYTISNATKFYWDNIYVGEPIVDNEPPVLEFIETTSDSTLLLRFNEPLEELAATLPTNYSVDNGIQNPVFAELNGLTISLTFHQKFQNGTAYLLTVSHIKDIAGNEMETVQMPFSWYQAAKFDVVFNEIYPDPSPSIGLPKYEFLELLNRTGKTISLNNWKLVIGTTEKEISDVFIKPNGYLILGKKAAANDYANFGDFYGFDSFSLTNSGQTLTLINNNGETISAISYTKAWYHNADKSEGGWSIEQINPGNVCSGIDNWQASESSYGGTPGSENSVYEQIELFPDVERFELVGNDIIRIRFNQAMDAVSLEEVNNFNVDQGVGTPSAVYTDETEPQKAELYFSTPFSKGLLYTMNISTAISNCMGVHPKEELKLSFAIPEEVLPLDMVINEILFNPLSDGVDYVELYNRSQKAIDLNGCRIGSVHISPPNPPDTSWYEISEKQLLFVPDSYLVLTKSPEIVQKQYATSNPDVFMEVNPFPSYNNKTGTVLITNAAGMLIDGFSYDESMQYPLLNYVDGVALERINPDGETNNANNWHSAAESVGFGTPGLPNSQWVKPEVSSDEITVEPEIFSPDNDGRDDVININYHFDKPGYNIKILVFDQNGRLVRNLIDNELAGLSGSISWDGVTNKNSKAQTGIYIFYIQVFDADGNVKSWKKTGVLATKF